MSHMKPEIVKGDFWRVETTVGDYLIPQSVESDPDNLDMYVEGKIRTDRDGERCIYAENGWFARLSAPGYLDCTDWSGPFDSKEEARDYLSRTYGDDECDVE